MFVALPFSRIRVKRFYPFSRRPFQFYHETTVVQSYRLIRSYNLWKLQGNSETYMQRPYRFTAFLILRDKRTNNDADKWYGYEQWFVLFFFSFFSFFFSRSATVRFTVLLSTAICTRLIYYCDLQRLLSATFRSCNSFSTSECRIFLRMNRNHGHFSPEQSTGTDNFLTDKIFNTFRCKCSFNEIDYSVLVAVSFSKKHLQL